MRNIFWSMTLVVACLFGAATAQAQKQVTANNAIVPGEVWNDTDGNPINAHGGGILYHEGTYYWYGEYKKGKTILPEWATWECYRTDVTGVSCYSSKDLLNWKFEGIVLPAVKDDQGHDLHTSKVLERPKVIYNPKTKKFVMWAHVESADYSKACAGVAVSDSPTGEFTYLGSFRPNNAMSRDQTVFVDDDGRAYHFYSSENNATLYISELTDDYQRPSGRYTRNFVKESREAPAVFKRNGKYYMLSSGCTGWDPNQAELAVADSIMGEWKTIGNPCTGTDADKTFYAQSTYVQKVMGKKDMYIAMFDRWNKKDLENSRYVWLPFSFEGDKITIPWRDKWSFDSFADQGRFEAGKGTFLLNGKPFVVKAAELHYPRIPKPYWDQRIKLCKALGMNTVCLYVFWNSHEPQPGVYDFTEQNDLAEFCRLCQQNDMYVILRPGPYVCAEWEMGGLPWWLLKKKDVRLRESDPYFIERVALFEEAVAKQVKDLTIANGGPIIMVQVENEYGSYGTDKPYVSAVRDLVRESGFTDVPLFQCDWSSNFTRNALDDLIWTINFGTGANIDQQFKKLKELRPETPLMCSEFWSGWFDHWGRKHETRPAKDMVQGIKEMLDRNISFSLYMTHGGTTFGHWGGANNPAYSAMCSSYDYDAPISEAGWTTEKYFLLRDLLKTYLPAGEALPEVPDALPVIEIPEFHFTKVAPFFSNLPAARQSVDIQPMEQFNQGWGTILYRTTLPEAVSSGTTLKITEVHDWAQIFADGKLLARLDRRKGEFTTTLPALKKGTQLDILVEAMGRVNFDKSIHDRKGITEKVELLSGDRTKELKNWTVYNFPVDYSFIKNKKYKDTKILPTMPAYYQSSFKLDKVGDTFLDMSTWGKGMVWVNGHAMGRFWEIGPQQTLFIPGCWRKEGENEILVLDLKGPAKASMKGLKKPILDVLREKAPETHRKDGEKLKLTGEKVAHEGAFTPGNGWQEVRFAAPVKGRFFCLEALSPQANNNIAAIAEFDVLGADGKPVSREHWKIRYADSEETRSGNRTADKIFDLQESTFWMTVDNVAYPHQLVIDLSKVETVTGFRYLPRAEKNYPGMIREYRVYVKPSDFKY